MARKRRTERERAVDKPPPFDKEDFLRKEISDAKLTFVTFFIALLFTAGSIGIYHAGSPGLAVLLGFIGFPALPFLHRLLGYDLDRMFPFKDGKKEETEIKAEKRARSMRMVGQWFTYFFTWLAIFVVALNPPFADVSGPAIVKIEAKLGDWHWSPTAAEPLVIRVNTTGNITLIVTLTDHTGVHSGSVRYIDLINPPESRGMVAVPGDAKHGEYSTSVQILSATDQYRFVIDSQDVNGRRARTPEFVIAHG